MNILRTEIYYSGFMLKDVKKVAPGSRFSTGIKTVFPRQLNSYKDIRRSLDHLDDLVQDSSISIANTMAIFTVLH